MPNPTQAQIRQRIDSFVSELDVLVRQSTLEALREILGDGAGPARHRRPAGRRGPGRPRGSGRGGDLDGAGEKILAFVRSNDGQGVREIAAGTGISNAVAKKAAAKLLASGQLKKSGQRRGTKYHIGSGRAPVASAKRGKRRGRRKKA